MENNNFRILVTGGSGFIGSHLVEALVSLGHFVKVIDNQSRSNLKDIEYLISSKKIEYIDGDIRYKDVVDSAMKNIDYVYHMAATNINRSLDHVEESFDVNLNGSRVVFQSALEHNVKKVIFSSSASVYGEPKTLPMKEDVDLNPITPYCVSKLSSEYLLKFLSKKGLNYVILRYFNVYGPRQHTDAYYTSVILLFIKRLLANEPPMIDGKGKQSMDFIHVKDIIQANILSLGSSVNNEIFNIGSGKSTTINDLAKKLINLMGKDIKPIFSDREVIVSRRQADVSHAKKVLNFSPKIDFNEGLQQVLKEVLNDIKK